MYGWSSDEVKGQLLDRLLRTDPETWRALNQELDERGAWEGELRQARRDGTQIVVHSREVLVHDENGERLAVLAINRDVTQLKRVIEALKQADQRKDEFLAVLAHELRNPLAPIRNAAAIMRWSGNDPAAVARVRETLDRQTEQLSRIVEDLVDVSRIVEGKIELRKERVRLAPLVETAVEASRSLLDSAGHRLSVELPEEPLYLEADPIRIAQVFTNLLNNAAKFTDAGGHVWLNAERVSDGTKAGSNHDHGEVVLRVRDTGIGITPELLPKIFEIFTQGRRPDEPGRGGLGVGLSLVRSLVQMHGGTVEAHSAGPGLGSEFVVRLPLADASLADDGHLGTVDHGKEETPGARPVSNPRRVLVVDDSTDQADTLGLLLELMGHEVRVAHAGLPALEIAADFEPDVALVDIGLPDIDGYDLARRLRAQSRPEQILLIAQTGWGQTKDRRRSKDAGFDHHLVKPVDADSLERLLSSPAKR
jgi:signal transduction histidine kinase/CheY-like chemotaxis protein